MLRVSQTIVMLVTLRHLSSVSERVNPQSWPRLTEFCGPEATSGRRTLTTLVVAAVVLLWNLPFFHFSAGKLKSGVLKVFLHFAPRMTTSKCSILVGQLQTLVPASKRGPGGWEISQTVK